MPAGTARTFWLRLTKTGTNYTGEYSFDGTTWTAIAGTVANPMAAPDFGALRVRPAGRRPGRHRVVRLLLARRPGPAGRVRVRATAPATSSTAATLDKTKWNAIVRDDPTQYARRGRLARGHDRQRRHLHQRRPGRDAELHPADGRPRRRGLGDRDEDRRARLNGGYEQAGLLVHEDDDNYIKFDTISDDGQTVMQPARAALRGRRGDPERRSRQIRRCRPGNGRGLAAPDQDGHQLHGRVLVRRDDVDAIGEHR